MSLRGGEDRKDERRWMDENQREILKNTTNTIAISVSSSDTCEMYNSDAELPW